MKRKLIVSKILPALFSIGLMLTGCNVPVDVSVTSGNSTTVEEVDAEETSDELTEEISDAEITEEAPDEEDISVENTIGLEDGVYTADFDTDNSMFHVNDACEGKGVLTVAEGKATIHVVLTSKNIVNLYLGLAKDAVEDEANWLNPTVEEVAYPDGTTDEANAFDVPVYVIGEEFDLALIGTKQKWYDHKVSVSNPELFVECNDAADVDNDSDKSDKADAELTSVNVVLEGGTGKAKVESPADITMDDNGKMIATIKWSSPHYDYMIVDGEKYLPVNTEGNSVFEIPIDSADCSMDVIADTTAMSTPHEIEYTLTFSKQ